MNTTEKEIIVKISEALPNMSEFDKGYFLGAAEMLAKAKKKKEPEEDKVS